MTYQNTTLISVCASKDLEVWSIAAQYICRNISANRYCLYVPDDEIALFKARTPENFEIVGERSICGDFIEELRACIEGKAEDRFGWYLQQFLKLFALHLHRADDLIVIWDADTVPLKPISFGVGAGQVLHYSGREYNRPYFDAIEQLLGMKRAVNYSFVAQSLAMKGEWLRSFFDEIEHRHGKSWQNAILDVIDFDQGAGFSEYETLGTFSAHRFGPEMLRSRSSWHRFGNRTIGSVHNLTDVAAMQRLAKYDFVSFEAWDKPEPMRKTLFRKIKNILRN